MANDIATGTACASEAFVLLDDCDASAASPSSRLYTQWHASLICTDIATLDDWQCRLQQALADGWHAVLLADYEWGLPLQKLPPMAPTKEGAMPCLRVELFAQMQHLHRDEVEVWLVQQTAQDVQAGIVSWQAGVSEAQYTDAIAQIHAAIERGDTYQINYTVPFVGRAFGSPMALYQRLRHRQPAQYGALMHLPHTEVPWVLSLSPELFLQVQDRQMTAKPMKGTTAVRATPELTQAAAHWLQNDAKNRAENVMIVDLLRNDLGAVATTGSVRVSDLFTVQRNGAVMAMISTIQAQLQPHAGIADVLRATFPCGSITGAPKRKTMEWIAALEGATIMPKTIGTNEKVQESVNPLQLSTRKTYQRGLYTGAIGWVALSGARDQETEQMLDRKEHPKNISTDTSVAPESTGLDYCLSVAIRTLLLRSERTSSPFAAASKLSDAAPTWSAQLSVGGGIVWDSVAQDEWRECQLKGRFAMHDIAGFELFETMRLEPEDLLPAQWLLHVQRLLNSAQALGFVADSSRWQEQALAYLAAHDVRGATRPAWRWRMALQSDGSLSFKHGVLTPLATGNQVKVLLHDAPCSTPAWLRQYKTSLRHDYDAAMHAAEAAGAFDSLFFNEQGHLTEGARSNVLVRLPDANGRLQWYTPPVSDGLLPGVMRRVLLADAQWSVQEKSITRAQLLQAPEVVVCNALRGVLYATVQAPS